MEEPKHQAVIDRILSLYTTSKWHDIEFYLKDEATGKTVVCKAHRIIIASASPVFEALCFGPIAEKFAVEVTDVEPYAFNAMLQFIYTDRVDIPSVEIASSLYYAGKKYLLYSLCTLASKYLRDHIDEVNSIDLFNLANMFDDEKLSKCAWEYIRRHVNDIAPCVKSESLQCELISKLVNENVVDGEEINIVRLAQSWAKENCVRCGIEVNSQNVRKVLMQCNILQKIRWRLLKDDEFRLLLPGLLTEEEINVITSSRKINDIQGISRLKPPLHLMYIHRYVEKKELIKNLPEELIISTRLTVSRSAMLHGIFICGKLPPLMYAAYSSVRSVTPTARYMEHISFTVVESGTVIHTQEFKKDVEYGQSFFVKLDHPLKLRARKLPEIRIHLFKGIGNYDFARRNNVGKIPCGLAVAFYESANLNDADHFVPSPALSLLTGLELSW